MHRAATLLRQLALGIAAAFFVAAGVGHFTNEAFFLSIVPPWVPWPKAAVWLSGVAEIAGGIGILVPATRQWAGWGLLALLVAVYPANIHMAMNPELFPDMEPSALYLRLPLQFVMAGWVWWVTKPAAKPDAPA